MASLALEAGSMGEDETAGNPSARTPLTDWQRRQVLIAAAATAALEAPVRILDIRPAGDSASRWARKGRAGVRPAGPKPWLRRSSAASQAEPEPQTEQGGQGE